VFSPFSPPDRTRDSIVAPSLFRLLYKHKKVVRVNASSRYQAPSLHSLFSVDGRPLFLSLTSLNGFSRSFGMTPAGTLLFPLRQIEKDRFTYLFLTAEGVVLPPQSRPSTCCEWRQFFFSLASLPLRSAAVFLPKHAPPSRPLPSPFFPTYLDEANRPLS